MNANRSPVPREAGTTSDDELVLVEDHGDWALITLNRPHKRNAMNRAAQRRLREALREVHEKKVVVLTGVGTSFCSGIDLTEAPPAAQPGRRASASIGSWAECNEEIRRHPALFIAAVNGFALGGGSTLVHNCELAIAAEAASIGTPEMAFGAWTALSGPSLINRVLPKHAAELIFLAKRVDARTALRMGMVNEVVADDQLLPRAFELAERIATFDATTLDWGKRAFRAMVNASWEESMELSRRTGSAIAASRSHEASPLD
ncbi:enoyl-CoA hydratase [Amycolatopsis endophytica]|uniref:Enoyl-CoA hydratase/carnithine racemase n=1 Tax=Amycolatopsis endophytica TaxID=860233 RepID=A0A853B9K9_9PSEU|nr:enoyl-CoA hydratase/isomerase family protein [Amycolatopsis endophytica]NYI91819.1 enoyl-CoA hydratase/carnithine racemase [Amycolatopsis endophytica]